MHTPVLAQEVCHHLPIRDRLVIVDGTFGYGGHYLAICDVLQDRLLRYLGVDQDPVAIAYAESHYPNPRLTIVHGDFRSMSLLFPEIRPDVVLLDLGTSFAQLTDPHRGFSVHYDAPLDMRMNPKAGHMTALDILQTWDTNKLASALAVFAGVPRAFQVAKRMKAFATDPTESKTTQSLIDALKSYLPKRKAVHPATTVFQCLRMLVNDEMGALEAGIPAAIAWLPVWGRLMVISFHSVEHRLVKRLLKAHHACGTMMAKGIHPSEHEISANPACRSAQLWVFEKHS